MGTKAGWVNRHLDQRWRVNALNQYHKAKKTLVTVGTNRLYGAIHQFGGTIKPKDGKKFLVWESGGTKIFARKVVIPPRPFFPVSKDGQVWSVAQ